MSEIRCSFVSVNPRLPLYPRTPVTSLAAWNRSLKHRPRLCTVLYHTVTSVLAAAQLAFNGSSMITSHVLCGFYWLGSNHHVWGTATSVQRSLLLHVSIFNMLTLFCSIFCSSICFPWISFAEMKCQYAGIDADEAWCAIVLHIKSW